MSRPIPSWHGVVGQRETVEPLRNHCIGAKNNGRSASHSLLTGPSGTGKTALAKAVATEMGTNCREIYCSRQTTKDQVVVCLHEVRQGDIVFLDEVHNLNSGCQEILFPAIDNKRIPLLDDSRTHMLENEWTDMPAFTLILATDQPGNLRSALKRRMVLNFTLAPYTPDELRQIVLRNAANANILLTPQSAMRFAEAARGNPRRARQLLSSFRTVTEASTTAVTRSAVERHLKSLGIDDENMEANDRRYLNTLLSAGGHMALPTIARQIGLDATTVQNDIEIYLIRKSLIQIQSRGRILTPAGKTIAQRNAR